jgi:hypothetical protein
LANTAIGAVNSVNGAVNAGLSLAHVKYQFQTYNEFDSSTVGEKSAMASVFVLSFFTGAGEEKAATQLHHIATDKNIAGGFTAAFERLFSRAGMSLQDSENLMPLEGHAGRHAPEYHQWVLSRLQNATSGLSGPDFKTALVQELRAIRDALVRNPGLVKGN